MATSASLDTLTPTVSRCQIHIFKYKCRHDGQENRSQCAMNGRGSNQHCIPQILWSDTVRSEVCASCVALSPADACPAGGVRVRGNGNGNGATSSSENTHGDGGLQRAASPERDTRTSRATRSSRHFARRRLRTRRDQVVSQRPAFGKRIKVPIFRDANLSHFIVKRPTSKRGVLRQVIVQMTRSKMPAAVRYAMGMKKARMNLEARLRAKVDIDGGGENEVSELSARLSSLTCK